MSIKISDLTLEEKLKLLAGKDNWHTEDLGGKLYEVTVSDGPLGVRKPAQKEDGTWYDQKSIAYPSAEVLSQTWDPALAYEMGKALADDCKEMDVDILLAPGVNIKRTPMCGRNFEYLSEDPYVAGAFGREYIRGLEENGIGTSLKHYCANSREYGRLWVSSEMDERTLRELYLYPFMMACQADPLTIMCSYNLVNGRRMSENQKLYEILRKEFWREDGLIMSDWGAVKDHAESVRAGLDLEMPYSAEGLENLRQAYEKGELTEEAIDKCVGRVLQLIEICRQRRQTRQVLTTSQERYALARRIAGEGAVLLKNNGVLPIRDGQSVSISGEHFGRYYRGDGSSRVQALTQPQTLLSALQKVLPNSKMEADGVWDGYSLASGMPNFLAAFEIAYGKDVAIVECGFEDSEGDDRREMTLRENERRLILEIAEKNPNTVVVLRYGAAVDMTGWIDKVAAVISVGYAGEQGNEALADLLTGRVNPSGRLTETFANSRYDYLSENCFRSHRLSVYSDGLQVGYRYFDSCPEKVRFPFGYGLSYSEFAYSNLQVQVSGSTAKLSFDITNTSDTDGSEVAQVYVREVYSKVFRPDKELKAFRKVFVPAGKTVHVTLELDRWAFAYYSVARDQWMVEGGTYEILVGKNARDICLKEAIRLETDI